MLPAGELNQRVTITFPPNPDEASKNSFGELAESSAVYVTVLAKVEVLSGREFWQAKQVAEEVDYRITIRNLAGLEANMKAEWEGHKLEFIHCPQPPRGEDMVILAKEVR